MPPPKKSGSGCGCLLAFLIVVGIIAAIGRFGSRSEAPSKADPAVTTERLFSSALPSRPMAPFYPPAPPLGPYTPPVMRQCLIETSRGGSTNEYSIQATVGPGSRGRVKLAVYLLDSFNYSVASRDYDYRNSDGTLSTGCWVNGSAVPQTNRYGAAATTAVRLSIPMSSARSSVAAAQFSLFDENGVELDRVITPVNNLTPPGYHDAK